MCIIAVCKTRRLKDSEIEASFRSQKDGAGIAWFDADHKNLNYIKGLMTVEEFKAVYAQVPDRQHVVHFRTSTAHGACKELTHPFIVSEKSPLYTVYHGKSPILFHNGVLSMWKDKLIGYYERVDRQIPSGLFSDTRYIAIRLAKLGYRALEYYDGKYVYMSPQTGTLVFSSSGIFTEEDGVAFSASGYKEWTYDPNKNKNENIKDFRVRSTQTCTVNKNVDTERAKKEADEYLESLDKLGYEKEEIEHDSESRTGLCPGDPEIYKLVVRFAKDIQTVFEVIENDKTFWKDGGEHAGKPEESTTAG